MLTLLFCFIFFVSTLPAMAEEQTARFGEIERDIVKLFDKNIEQQLRSYKLVFVSGFISQMSKIVREKHFGVQEKWAKEEVHLGDENLLVAPVNTFANSEVNSLILKEIIEKSDLPVLFIVHSKGGLDLLATLINYPELRPKVKGIVTIQTPYRGTPVADSLDQNIIGRLFFKSLLRLGGGDYGCLQTLGTKLREDYLQENQKEIEQILKEIVYISFAGWTDENSKAKRSNSWSGIYSSIVEQLRPLDSFNDNDDLVPKESQILPNSHYILRKDSDHLSFVASSAFNEDKIKITKSLIVLLLELMSAKDGEGAER